MKTKRLFFCLFLLTLALLLCACEKNDSVKDDASKDELPYHTANLSYILTEDGKAYLVSGIGAATDTDIIIPTVYMGKPVVGITKNCFKDEKGITSVVIPEGISAIPENAFYGCSELSSVSISADVEEISALAFAYCESLNEITVDKANRVYHSAGNCLIETERKILIVGTNSSIIPSDGSVTVLDSYSFFGRRSLTSITIPAVVTAIDEVAFGECALLSAVILEEGFGGEDGCGLDDYTFYRCTSLAEVTIPSSIKNIGSYNFMGCTALSSVRLSDSITFIGDQTFDSCTSLTDIYYGGSIEEWNAIYKTELWKKGAPHFIVHCANGNLEE